MNWIIPCNSKTTGYVGALPNITGLTRSISCAQFSTNEGDEGAMYLQEGQKYRAEVNNSVIQPRVGIDASRSSGVYGASMTVQPSALRGLACIKI
nr:MAG TPA: hypothetical protein [Caudoviricetes sp.]